MTMIQCKLINTKEFVSQILHMTKESAIFNTYFRVKPNARSVNRFFHWKTKANEEWKYDQSQQLVDYMKESGEQQ